MNRQIGRAKCYHNLLLCQQYCDCKLLVQVELDAMANGTGDLATAAQLEGLKDEQVEGQGPTMMGRQARQLMMSGQGNAGLQAFKVHALTYHNVSGLPKG